ncbi:MAG: NUDIX hydrolase [Candidatus Thorarchaeota archaeon]|nr:NUDIX hydrolase [Candidatus Thorarchaeota archaeon]
MYKNPKPTVDVAIINGENLVLVRRGRDPYKGRWVFPGGFIDYGETAENAAVREALEETSMQIEITGILGVYSDASRDPRGHTQSTVFIARPLSGEPKGGDDAAEAKWHRMQELGPGDLAFDHDLIMSDLRRWMKDKSKTFWSTISRE